jgi:hypothetical protein
MDVSVFILVYQVAYIDTEGFSSYRLAAFLPLMFEIGTFRPDRIRSVAERFGVNGDLALENILYGQRALFFEYRSAHAVTARAFNSEHQMELINECSMRFAEDKDFRLLVRWRRSTLTVTHILADRR